MTWDITFKPGFNCIVHGSSGTGKTTFVYNLLALKNELFAVPPSKVIWFYNKNQPIYDLMKKESLVDEFVDVSIKGIPTSDDVTLLVHPYKDKGGSLLIFDDILTQLTTDFENIFVHISHHEQASVILMTQNLFYKGGIFRTLSLNSHYFVFMKNSRDKQQIGILARQICPGNSNYIVQSYEAATKKPFSYLLADFRADTPATLRLRANIFPTEFPTKVFLET